MNIEQPLNGMTWEDLRAFVALGSHEPDDAEVVFGFDESFEVRSMLICRVLVTESFHYGSEA